MFPQIEFDENGEQLIHTFFTRPYKSSDKARCERNHRELRKLFPKGKPLAHFTQEQIDEAFSHLNSSTRKVLVRHINIGMNTTISTSIIANSTRIDSTNLTFTASNPNRTIYDILIIEVM